jgi:hypothetical protein
VPLLRKRDPNLQFSRLLVAEPQQFLPQKTQRSLFGMSL